MNPLSKLQRILMTHDELGHGETVYVLPQVSNLNSNLSYRPEFRRVKSSICALFSVS